MKINDEQRFELMNSYEKELYKKGLYNVVGIDEVGRGPLAGPVVVAGVILDYQNPIYGLNDSKKISHKKRLELNEKIITQAIAYNICEISSEVIDQIGIANAIRSGVKQVLNALEQQVNINHVLVDYMKVDLTYNHHIIKKGDQNSNSIAAASIVAKVYRDNLMSEIGKHYEKYKFENNAGYGTKEHVEAIKSFGIIKGVHRESFEPIKSRISIKGEK